MAHHYDRAVKLLDGVLEYIFGLHVKVVGRLVEYEQIDRFEKQTYHGQTRFLTA